MKHRATALALVLLVSSAVGGAQANRPRTAGEYLERAKAILERAPLVDGHNDLPSALLLLSPAELERTDLRERHPRLPADVPRLRAGKVGAQFWAAFVDVSFMRSGDALGQALREIDMVHRLVKSQPDFELARTADDIERITQSSRIASLIGVEGGHAIENSLAALRMFHQLGVRYMTLTHMDTIDWADAATDHPRHKGLTEFGESVVREMNRLGMFVDISHVSADTMRDVLRVSRAPVIFSHSNALAINAHPRNVPDDVLQETARNSGVVMMNFIAGYVAPGAPAWTVRRTAEMERLRAELDDGSEIARQASEWDRRNPAPRGTIADVAAHIDHIRKVAGIDHIGIGSDYFDAGGPSMAEGLDDVSAIPALFAELLRRGYSDEDVMKIAGRNVLRAMRRMETIAADIERRTAGSLASAGRSR